MLAKRFFYVCVGVLCLAYSYQVGASRAAAAQGTAQGATQSAAKGKIRFVDSRGAYVVVVSDTDDIYVIDPEKLPQVARGPGWWKFNIDAVR